ncbi:MAG TPA: hypothetical protein VMS16_03455, partial [Mycobacterium sp.]|nr:hypothetical protein [Mycobacterium sp.]
MKDSSVVASRLHASERVGIHVDSRAARWIGTLALLSAACWLIALLAHDHDHEHAHWQAAGRLAWSLTVLAAVAFVARGIFLGRPVTARHATAAVLTLVLGMGAHVLSFDLVGELLIA